MSQNTRQWGSWFPHRKAEANVWERLWKRLEDHWRHWTSRGRWVSHVPCVSLRKNEINTILLIKQFGFSGVRRRNKSKKDTTQEDASKKDAITKSPVVTSQRQHEQNPRQDPLKWFGILLPQSLKHAQSSFKQGMMWKRKCLFTLMWKWPG